MRQELGECDAILDSEISRTFIAYIYRLVKGIRKNKKKKEIGRIKWGNGVCARSPKSIPQRLKPQSKETTYVGRKGPTPKREFFRNR
jgi:hypothetical protein